MLLRGGVDGAALPDGDIDEIEETVVSEGRFDAVLRLEGDMTGAGGGRNGFMEAF